MPIELMYITNRTEIAEIAQASGIDRIFLDMEYIGKQERQGGMNTVQLHHTTEDVRRLRGVLHETKLLVRCNPIHDRTARYDSTEFEVDRAVNSGADILMLPFFKSAQEVRRFVHSVNGRARVSLLLETPQAVENLDQILAVGGIDEIHIGLNDLHLGYHMKFMFELLADGTVDRLCDKIRQAGISYGFGGVARVGTGTLPAEYILGEHYRLGSDRVILSRSFCNLSKEKDVSAIREKMQTGVAGIRAFESTLCRWNSDMFRANHERLCACVQDIVKKAETIE